MTYFDPVLTPAEPRTLLILGPTAGGKSALGLALARDLPGGGEIVGADSMQVYRGMDIGTAKASAAERAAVPHHLLDVADPHGEAFTAADWLERAREAIVEVHRRGRHAVVVGGTSLYIKSLVEGMFDGPDVDPVLRASLEALPSEMLRTDLEQRDPVAAARIHPNDRRRTIRAIEVHTQTGERISALQAQWSARPRPLPPGWCVVGLEWTVPGINQRINARVTRMMEEGLVAEVEGLLRKGVLNRQAVEAVGYQECIQHLAGDLELDAAAEAIKVRTRRLAKQQRTWLRRFRAIPDALWLEADGAATEDLASKVRKNILRSDH